MFNPGNIFAQSMANQFLRAQQELRDAELNLARMEKELSDSHHLVEEARALVAHRKGVLAALEALVNSYRRPA